MKLDHTTYMISLLPESHHKMTIHPIVRGIYLVSHEIEGFIMPFEKNNSGIPLYTFNYCLSGRCEFHKTDDKVSYLSPGIVCIGKKENLSSFYYPLGHYTSYEIYFIDIFIKDLSVRIPVRTISDQFGISETYLKNCFKEVYGLCISEYMASYRMREAARLLTGTDMSILEIARKIGYTNQGRFAKVFRDHYRMKPLKYRHSV